MGKVKYEATAETTALKNITKFQEAK